MKWMRHQNHSYAYVPSSQIDAIDRFQRHVWNVDPVCHDHDAAASLGCGPCMLGRHSKPVVELVGSRSGLRHTVCSFDGGDGGVVLDLAGCVLPLLFGSIAASVWDVLG